MAISSNHTVTISSLGVEIEIQAPHACDLHASLSASNRIPNFIPNPQIEKRNAVSPAFTVCLHDSDQQSIEERGSTIHFYDALNAGVPDDITFILQKLFDHAYQRKGLLTFHSSAISVNNNGVLFIGAAGSGKTTIALTAEFLNAGKFISNNRTVIQLDNSQNGLPTILAGTDRISLRAQSLRSFHEKFDVPIPFDVDVKSTSYDPNIYLSLEKLGLTSSFSQTKLSRVCLVQLSQGFEERIDLNSTVSIVRLYENASRAAWGNALVFDGKLLSPVNETSDQAQSRLDGINAMAQHVNVVSLKGSPEFILKEAVCGL